MPPTGRPPIFSTLPDGSRRLYCPCGVIMFFRPGSGPEPTTCFGCHHVYAWPGVQQPLPQPTVRKPSEPRLRHVARPPGARGAVPMVYVTDIDCLTCARRIGVVRHLAPVADMYPYRHLLCGVCGGAPMRGQTVHAFAFTGEAAATFLPNTLNGAA